MVAVVTGGICWCGVTAVKVVAVWLTAFGRKPIFEVFSFHSSMG